MVNRLNKIMPVITAMCIMPVWLLYASDKSEVSLETKTKAVFLYNFTKFIQWPEEDTSKTFNIVILGNSDIYSPLQEIANKQTVNNKALKIIRLKSIPENLEAHIVFISSSEKAGLKTIIQKVQNHNVLIVSDSKGFAAEGTAINFVVMEGKVKFEINSATLDNSNLKVSSQLLKLALFVEEK